MPTVSVIVPVYKVEPFIHRCLDSILNQTFTDHEPILVDDGSPDSCGEMCEEYAVADSRVIVIHQKNGGLSCARNTGIDFSFACSDSEWISFIDSDDWVNHHYLEYLIDACVTEKSDMAVCAFQRTDGNDFTAENVYAYSVFSAEDLWSQKGTNAVVAWGKLYQKSLWQCIRYPINKFHEDEYITYKLIFASNRIPLITSALYFYYQNLTGIMKSGWSPKRLDSTKALNQQIRFFKKHDFPKSAEHTARKLIKTLASHITGIEKSKGQYDNYLLKVKRLLRKYLRRYHKLARINIHNSRRIYTWAFPIKMKVYSFYSIFAQTIKDNGLGVVLKKFFIKIWKTIFQH